MNVGMAVLVAAVGVRMAVHGLRVAVIMMVVVVGGEMLHADGREAARGVTEAERPEANEHGGDEQLEARRHPRVQREIQREQGTAGDGEGGHVAEPPQSADERPGEEAALPRHDGRHGHEVIGIGGVLQAEDEPQGNGREERIEGYGLTPRTLRSPRSIAFTPTS